MADVRRVTGSSDIPLTPDGQQQAAQMAAKLSHPFDYVFTSPEDRSIATAQHFHVKPVILKGLDAWYRGSHEGKPANSVKGAMQYLITNPDKVPPGVSPISGKAGESYNTFIRPLNAVMRVLKKEVQPDKRALLVTSGGNLQAIDQMAGSDFPKRPTSRDLAQIAKRPYWSQVGTLFKLTDKGLHKVTDNKEPGLYLSEHSATAFNSKSPR